MADTPGSKDKALEALDFIINVLKEHEQTLDKSIEELALVAEQKIDTEALNGKIEKLDQKIGILQKEVTALISYLSNLPKDTLPTLKQAPELRPAAVQSAPTMILQCKQWADFQALAMHAGTLTFSFKEPEKTLRVDAVRGNQIITYTGAVTGYSAILKTWLSRQLDTPEQNILEGSLGKPK